MNITDIVIVVIVAAVVAVAVWRFVGTATGKRDCCSGDVKDPGAGCGEKTPVSAVAVTDTDESHYAHEALVGIGGMTCEHCVAAVTAALNSVGGTWATVRLQGGSAKVLCKEKIDEAAYRRAVEQAGYRVVSFSVKR